jgi:hypothetical protein
VFLSGPPVEWVNYRNWPEITSHVVMRAIGEFFELFSRLLYPQHIAVANNTVVSEHKLQKEAVSYVCGTPPTLTKGRLGRIKNYEISFLPSEEVTYVVVQVQRSRALHGRKAKRLEWRERLIFKLRNLISVTQRPQHA